MDHCVVGDCTEAGLSVALVNPDARNLKWRKDLFEYTRCTKEYELKDSQKNDIMPGFTYLPPSPKINAPQRDCSVLSVKADSALSNQTFKGGSRILSTGNSNTLLKTPQTTNTSFPSPVSSYSLSPFPLQPFPMLPTPVLMNLASPSCHVPALQHMGKVNNTANGYHALSSNVTRSSMSSGTILNSIVTNPIQSLLDVPVNKELISPASALLNDVCFPKSSVTSVTSSSSDSSASPPVWTAQQREIGNMIYYELKSEFPERVAKLTGMMLALPKNELNRLICDKQKLKARAHEFLQLLNSD